MKYPKYIKSADGYIGAFYCLDFGGFPIYRFPGGCRNADTYEIENGSDNREDLEKAIKHEQDVARVAAAIQSHPWYEDTPIEECKKMAEYQVRQWDEYAEQKNRDKAVEVHK